MKTESESGSGSSSAEAVTKRKEAFLCPWGHQPMWVINGDWKNPDVKCSVASCPAAGKEVSLKLWNEWTFRAATVGEQPFFIDKRTVCPGCGLPHTGDHMCEIEPQGAVEWVKGRIISESDGPIEWLPEHLPSPDALELAQRCDAAEHRAKSATQRADAFERAGHELKAQLALEKDNSRQSREEIEALKADVAAAEAKFTLLKLNILCQNDKAISGVKTLHEHKAPSPSAVLALASAAKYIGVCGKTLAKYVDEEMVPVIMLPSGVRRFRRVDLDEFLNSRRVPAVSSAFFHRVRSREDELVKVNDPSCADYVCKAGRAQE